MGRFRKFLHWWSTHYCARDAPLIWMGNEIRCPICGRLLAYRYLNLKGDGYDVHICYSANLDYNKVFKSANADIPIQTLDPYGVEYTILKLHQRPLEEDCLSSFPWDIVDDEDIPPYSILQNKDN